MRIAFVSHSADAGGGAELALLELAEALVARGDADVHVVLPRPGPLEGRLHAAGIATSVAPHVRGWVRPPSVPGRRARDAAAHLLATASLVRAFRALRPDAVVTNTLAIPAAALAARVLGLPHVWCVHEFGVRDHGFSFDLGFERTLRLIGRLSRLVVVNSRAVETELARWIPPSRLRLVRYAVHIPRHAPEAGSNGCFRAVLVGTKAPSKGQEDAIRALALLGNAGPPVVLRLVGGGDPRYVPVLEGLARELGVADRLELVPETSDPFSHLAWADVALVCSRDEAFGRVTVEAMKLGRPVVGARSGGTAELIDDGRTGLLYRPGDAADLADKVSLLRARPELRLRLGVAGRGWASEEFTSERHARDFLAVVHEAVR